MSTLPQRLGQVSPVAVSPVWRLLTASWFLPLMVLGLTAIVFGEVGQCRFVRWDDDIHVYENPWLHPVTPSHVGHFWRTPYEGLYIPLSYSVYALLSLVARESGTSALNPQVFHLTNLVLHLTNVLLVFVILRRLGGRDWAAASGAMLFAIHPMQAETVAWVSELRGLLAALLSLLAIWQYLEFARGPREGRGLHWGRYGLATVAFGLALLAKPSAVTVPLIALVLDIWCLGRSWRCGAGPLGVWVVIALAWTRLSCSAQPVPDFLLIPLWRRFFVAGDALAFYLGHLVWPTRLCIDYGRSPASVLAHPWGYAAWLVPAVIGTVAWMNRRRAPWLLASCLLFVAALLPVLGLIPFGFQRASTVADRYLYLAMLGPALVVAGLLPHIPRRAAPLAAGIGVGALFLLCLQSSLQVLFWQNDLTLFSQALAINPRSWIASNDLGSALCDRGQARQAIPYFEDSLRWNRDQPRVWNNLGAALNAVGRRPEAVAALQTSLSLAPGLVSALNTLGMIHTEQGRLGAGGGEFQAALRTDPEFFEARNNLGVVFEKQGEWAAAADQFRRALAIKPDYATARQNLSDALNQLSKSSEGAPGAPASQHQPTP